jgi:hypothetical protein
MRKVPSISGYVCCEETEDVKHFLLICPTPNDIREEFCFVTILDISFISRSCKNDHILFNVGTPSLEARNIRLVNIITYLIEESKLMK